MKFIEAYIRDVFRYITGTISFLNVGSIALSSINVLPFTRSFVSWKNFT
jgi:hypothetical protein